MNLPMCDCPLCEGTGKVTDNIGIGQQMREERKNAGLSLRTVAKRLGVSAAYVSDLELGRRNWSLHRVTDYQNALSPDFVNPEPFVL